MGGGEFKVPIGSRHGTAYEGGGEASGLLHLVSLLAALYDDEVGALIIDEPEVSLHPQLQSFVFEEVRRFAGDPSDPLKKIIIQSTHSAMMLPLRTVGDLTDVVIFTEATQPPFQIESTNPQLLSSKLKALLPRLGAAHKSAFFAKTIILVEGISDEIIVTSLAQRVQRFLSAGDRQVLALSGKGEMSSAYKLFKLMKKELFILGDLDAFIDSNDIVNLISTYTQDHSVANSKGHPTLVAFDSHVRSQLFGHIDAYWGEIEAYAKAHHYYKAAEGDETGRRRRSATATLLSEQESLLSSLPSGQKWIALRKMLYGLLEALRSAGCFILAKGTIEAYYHTGFVPNVISKPEAAVEIAIDLENLTAAEIDKHYGDVLGLIRAASVQAQIDEADYVIEELGSTIGRVLPRLTPTLTDTEIQNIIAGTEEKKPLFTVTNMLSSMGSAAIQVTIDSPLFPQLNFPITHGKSEPLDGLREKITKSD